jgi:hypothetical protein
VPGLHAVAMNRPETIRATLTFLSERRF